MAEDAVITVWSYDGSDPFPAPGDLIERRDFATLAMALAWIERMGMAGVTYKIT